MQRGRAMMGRRGRANGRGPKCVVADKVREVDRCQMLMETSQQPKTFEQEADPPHFPRLLRLDRFHTRPQLSHLHSRRLPQLSDMALSHEAHREPRHHPTCSSPPPPAQWRQTT